MSGIGKINTFKAFRSRNYKLYFWGRAVSQFGTAMQRMAIVWLIYSITHSAYMIGVTIFAELFPAFLLSIFGGITADRYNRYKIVNITQITSMIQSVLLAVLIISGHRVVWEILTLSVILGIINSFDVPARQSMMNDVLDDKADLPNALSLNASMASFGKLMGPVVAGIILETFGAGVCFILNAGSFGFVMAALAMMKNLPPYTPKENKKKIMQDFADGFAYLWKVPSIGLIIVVLALECMLVVPYDTLLPVYAKEIFKGSASTYGYITGFIATGAIIGSIFLASIKSTFNQRINLFMAMLLLAFGLIIFSYLKNFYLAMFFAVICGFGTSIQNTITNIIVQSETEAHMRGRAISVMLMAMFGMVPIGSLLVGWVSEKIGAPNTILGQGIIGLVIAIYFFISLRKSKRTKTNVRQTENIELKS